MEFSRQEYWSGLPFPSRKVKVAQLCLTLCDPMDYAVHGILQTRILEWVAFPFSREWNPPPYSHVKPALKGLLVEGHRDDKRAYLISPEVGEAGNV